MSKANEILNVISEDVPSEGQIDRVKKDWEKISGEKLEISFTKGVFTALGSELATLRLWKDYKGDKKTNQGFSKNMKKHFFSLETNL